MVVLTSFSPPCEGIRHEQPSTKLVINGREIGTGTLYIAESNLTWKNNATGDGFSLLYPHIAVHAVSRDIQSHGSECLFIMIDTCIEGIEENDEAEDNEEDTDGVTEMRFVPEDKGQLDAMYQAMNYCQSQHPCVDQLSEEDDEEFEDADEYVENAMGDSGAEHTNGYNGEDMETDGQDGQFQDAED